MVGAAVGFGGKLMRTVSFFGCTLPVSFFGGCTAPVGMGDGVGLGWGRSDIIMLFKINGAVVLSNLILKQKTGRALASPVGNCLKRDD
jgi:hypothetical protein